jgi:hypothetical protein
VSLSHDGKALGASHVGNNMPSFDVSLPLNVTTQYGAHAHLVCRVQDVANKSVRFAQLLFSTPILYILLILYYLLALDGN